MTDPTEHMDDSLVCWGNRRQRIPVASQWSARVSDFIQQGSASSSGPSNRHPGVTGKVCHILNMLTRETMASMRLCGSAASPREWT